VREAGTKLDFSQGAQNRSAGVLAGCPEGFQTLRDLFAHNFRSPVHNRRTGFKPAVETTTPLVTFCLRAFTLLAVDRNGAFMLSNLPL
jgi:hypothetical protein